MSAAPGWVYLAIIALVSNLISKLLSSPSLALFEPSIIAVLFGMLLSNRSLVPKNCLAGVKRSESVLALGIVIMGATFDLALFGTQGLSILITILVTMSAGLISVYVVGKLFSLSNTFATLLAVGTSICGGTAIAIIAPLIKAKDEETSYAIATISLWGLAAILLYPILGRLLGMDDTSFGVFAGTAVHSTPQVVGAGFAFSETAGNTATAVKLVRNCFIAPFALIIALAFNRSQSGDKVNLRRAFPWFLFGYFVLAGARTLDVLPLALIGFASDAGKFGILMGMAGVGLNTNIGAFRRLGSIPLLVGLFGAVAVAITSLLFVLM